MASAPAAGASGPGPIVYSAIPATLPGNVPSQAFEATQTKEFGDEVGLGQQGYLSTARVVMSSWGCQSGGWSTNNCVTAPNATFTHPITFNVYAVDNSGPTPAPGQLLLTKTQMQTVPYRPSADNVNCTGGRWFNSADSTCYNGMAAPITFDMSDATGPGAGQVLPAQVIWTVKYNTSDYGDTPLRPQPCNANNNCPYDSLNVGAQGPVNTGTDTDPDGAFVSSTYSGAYCDNGAGGTGTLRLDTGGGTPCGAGGDWTGFTPMAELQLFPLTAPPVSLGSVSVPEGNAGPHSVTVPVTLGHPYAQTVTVNYQTADGTAMVRRGDYTAASGTLTFAPGSVTPTSPLTVSVNGDTTAEKYEQFNVTLSSPANATLGTASATVQLQNDDFPTALHAATVVHIVEGQNAKVTFRVNFKYNAPITVHVSTQDGTATQSSGDYGPLPVSTITIPANTASASVLCPTHRDHMAEPEETFQVIGTAGALTASTTVNIRPNLG